jgi:hypothetical protein
MFQSPTTDQYIAGVSVVADTTESGSGCYDVFYNGTTVGYIHRQKGAWTAVRPGRNGDAGFLRSKDAVNYLVGCHRFPL